jgi:hypothetical protein
MSDRLKTSSRFLVGLGALAALVMILMTAQARVLSQASAVDVGSVELGGRLEWWTTDQGSSQDSAANLIARTKFYGWATPGGPSFPQETLRASVKGDKVVVER